MKIPKRVKIGGHNVKISVVETLPMKNADLGCVQVATQNIWITNQTEGVEISEGMQVESLLHEILHFISVQAGHGPQEKVVTALSAGLFQVIRDNNLDFRRK